MHSESEWIYERKQLYAIMKAHPEWSLRAYARKMQHDLRWVRKWTRRFRECREPSASMFRSQSRRPKHSPKRLTEKRRIVSARIASSCQSASTAAQVQKQSGTS